MTQNQTQRPTGFETAAFAGLTARQASRVKVDCLISALRSGGVRVGQTKFWLES